METQNNLKVLNALRMGVTPDTELKLMICGREIEKGEIDQLFKTIQRDQCSIVKFIQGEYGSGKTFLLEYIKQQALQQNYIVSNISINSGFNFSKIEQVYFNIMSSLSINNNTSKKGTDFDNLFDNWIKEIKSKKGNDDASKEIYTVVSTLNKYNNSFATVLLIYIRAKIANDYELAQIASSWIKGDQNISYELKKRLGVKGSIDRENAGEMLRGFVKLLQLMGYAGMIVTIDEAELMMNARSDIRWKAYGNVRYIMDQCGSNEIENTCFVFAGTNELFSDKEKGFKSYEALYQRIGDVVKDSSRINNSARQPILYLRDFTEETYTEILDKVLGIHEMTYEYHVESDRMTVYNLTKVECTKVLQSKKLTPRIFIKKLIDILDLLENNPDLAIFRTKVQSK